MSSEPNDDPSEMPGSFNSPVPDSWAQPVPDSWTSEPWPQQPDGGASPPPSASPGNQAQQPGGEYRPDGQYRLDGQYPPNGQHSAHGQHSAYGPYSAHGQYPSGQYSYQPQYFIPATVRNNRAAVAALICGIGQFVLGLALVGNILLAIPAIICGSIALKQIRLRGGRGHGMAIAGLVLGILGVFYFLLILIVIVFGVRVTSSSS
jgi:hypothetical protein